MNASIITIGDEILIGQIVDTNSAWLSEKLNQAGVIVKEIRSVSDSKEQIMDAVDDMLAISDVVFVTGGLGPTNDDITKTVFCEMFSCGLVLNQDALKNVHEMLGKRGISVNENNHNQAMVPEKCQVFVNKLGTAPGMMFKKGEKLIFSMPGVPFEMKYLSEKHFIPYIKEHFQLGKIYHKTILISGIPEAILAEKLTDWENSLSEQIKLAYLPSPGLIRLRLSVYDSNDKLVELVQQKIDELKQIIPNNYKSDIDSKPEELIANLLIEKNKTISTAESCTGGKIASMITSKAGSSEYFKGSVVSYANEIKSDLLNVDKNDLQNYGAVSQQVVEQMAKGVRKLMKTDYAVSTSGIAGPDGGTEEKPVGTVWIGLATPVKVISKKFLFYNDREINIQRSANAALMMLIDELDSGYQNNI